MDLPPPPTHAAARVAAAEKRFRDALWRLHNAQMLPNYRHNQLKVMNLSFELLKASWELDDLREAAAAEAAAAGE